MSITQFEVSKNTFINFIGKCYADDVECLVDHINGISSFRAVELQTLVVRGVVVEESDVSMSVRKYNIITRYNH